MIVLSSRAARAAAYYFPPQARYMVFAFVVLSLVAIRFFKSCRIGIPHQPERPMSSEFTRDASLLPREKFSYPKRAPQPSLVSGVLDISWVNYERIG